MSRFVSAAALAVMIGVSLFSRLPPRTPVADDQRRERLEKFAASLLAKTKPGDTIEFILPKNEDDGGLTNHRLRYLLPGRFVRTNLDRGTAPETHPATLVVHWP